MLSIAEYFSFDLRVFFTEQTLRLSGFLFVVNLLNVELMNYLAKC